jgi:outer membrane protein assembly factor BamD (BamD/ComL family)
VRSYQSGTLFRCTAKVETTMYRLSLLCLTLMAALSGAAQRPIYQYDPSLLYREAIDLFDHEKFVPAKEKFEQFIDQEKDAQHALRINAEYYTGLCALYLNHQDAEFLLEKFVHTSSWPR